MNQFTIEKSLRLQIIKIQEMLESVISDYSMCLTPQLKTMSPEQVKDLFLDLNDAQVKAIESYRRFTDALKSCAPSDEERAIKEILDSLQTPDEKKKFIEKLKKAMSDE